MNGTTLESIMQCSKEQSRRPICAKSVHRFILDARYMAKKQKIAP